MRRPIVLLAVLLAVPLAGRASTPVPLGPFDAVVSLIDTGINPYHKVFRDTSPRAYQHPSTYIPGYPSSAVALPVTLDAPTYAEAIAADCSLWGAVEPRTLYWFPGTKIVGAISFNPPSSVECDASGLVFGAKVLDSGSHGTMTASRATSTEYGACKECLVVAIQFPAAVNTTGDREQSTRESVDAIKWSASQASWIDVQSNSWGPIVPAYDPTGSLGLYGSNRDLLRAVEETSRAHLGFWASGNGAAFRAGVLGHPTVAAFHLTPSAVIVGGLDSGRMTLWPGFTAHVVSDACQSWAARARTMDESGPRVGGGTSGATPFAAGGAARILRHARSVLGSSGTGVHGGVVASGPAGLVPSGPLADGVFTLEEWKRVLYVTASERPVRQFEDGDICGGATNTYAATPVVWADVPPEYPEYHQIGYGAVDAQSYARAVAVLEGTAPAPDRGETDEYFATDRAVREAEYGLLGE